jgi:uncharacterized protein (TIGR03663 family)
VGTGSTKSGSNKSRTSSAKAAAAPEPEMSDRTRVIASVAILVVAAFLRLYNLNLVPFHHDEGVNGNFLVRLVREGYYHYDPANYHGPTLYYFSAVVPWLLRITFGVNAQNNYGLTSVAVRCVPALFGIATIALILTLRRNLGTIATLSAALLLAISPGAVYLSRYFIHETLFVFFTLGIVVALVKYWENPLLVYLVLAAISAALLFATKETAMISVAVLVIALFITMAFYALMQSVGPGSKKQKRSGAATADQTFLERVGGWPRLIINLAIALIVFLVVYVLFYSSFFTNYPQGIYDSLKTFKIWQKTGQEAHKHPVSTYVWWLLQQESPLLVLGAVGAIVAVLKPVKWFALFSALWAFGLMAAYSLIAYKTPWLALSFIIPLALSSGVAIEWFYESLASWTIGPGARWYVIAGVLLIAIGPLPGVARTFADATSDRATGKDFSNTKIHGKTFIPGYQTIDLNFFNYDNDNSYYVYVYAHSRREMLKLVEEINQAAQRTQQGADTGITIVSPDYWPLPWYLRDYRRVGYHGRMTASTEPIIIARQDQAAEVQATFGDRYYQVRSGFNSAGTFALRPGVELLLYTKRELAP